MPFDEDRKLTKALTAEKQQRDRDDWNNESAGRQTGRISRFFAGAASLASKVEDKRKEAMRELIRTLEDWTCHAFVPPQVLV